MATDALGRPIAEPTPYLSPTQGGNPYVTSGTVGVSIPQSSYPVASYPIPTSTQNYSSLYGYTSQYPSGSGTMYNTGQVVPSSQVLSTPQTTTAPVPTPNPGPTPTPTAPSGPSAEDTLRADIESIFSPVMSYLNQAETTLGQNQTTALGGIEGQYGQSRDTMANEKATSSQALQGQEKEAGTRKEDALTSATRLYSELTRGGQQRFGGASSAGEAYQSLTAVEQQRRQGEIQTAYEGAMQKVGQYKSNLEEKYNLAVKDLEVQKNQAINDVNTEFRNNMLSITQMKSEAESNKAQLRLQALQDLRNQVYTINLQNLQFAQQLALNEQTSLATVDQLSQQAMSYVTGGQNVVNNTLSGYKPGTTYGVSGPTGTTQLAQTTPIGSVTGTKKWDPITGTYV